MAKIDHAGNGNNPNGNNPKGCLALGLDRLDYVDLEIFTLGMVHRLSDSLRGFFSIFYSRRFRLNQCQSLTVWNDWYEDCTLLM